MKALTKDVKAIKKRMEDAAASNDPFASPRHPHQPSTWLCIDAAPGSTSTLTVASDYWY